MQIISTIGLVMNIIGVILLFFFGFPQPNFDEGVSLGLEDNTPLGNGKTVKEQNIEINRKKRIYKIMATVALVLLLFGFLFQLFGVWYNNIIKG